LGIHTERCKIQYREEISLLTRTSGRPLCFKYLLGNVPETSTGISNSTSKSFLVQIDNTVDLIQDHYFVCGPCSSVGIATGYGLDGPGIETRCEARFSAPVRTGPGAHPASCTMGTGTFLGVKSGRGVTLTSYPLPVPWSRKSRAKPLLSLQAVRPVQSPSACTRVYFTFTIILFDKYRMPLLSNRLSY